MKLVDKVLGYVKEHSTIEQEDEDGKEDNEWFMRHYCSLLMNEFAMRIS